jgi:hypothetical protein
MGLPGSFTAALMLTFLAIATKQPPPAPGNNACAQNHNKTAPGAGIGHAL